MVIQVGINGFGRIGRIVFRACLQNSDLQLSAINDPAISVEYICYLMKFDSTHGKLKGNISHTDHDILIDGNHIKVFQEKLPTSVPWHSAGVKYVVEASGMFTNKEKASGHLASNGVKRVIVTAPSADIPMILLGVNSDKLCPDTKVISCASSTLYCLAPIIKVLEDSFGVEEGFLTSIHAMTPSLKPLDGLCLRGRHWRDHRSIHQNIIPATTGACKALGKILPQLKDKLSGLAFRVPIVNVSVLDLTVRINPVMVLNAVKSLERRINLCIGVNGNHFEQLVRLQTDTTLQEIVKSVERASKTSLKNIIKISNDESVSSDFIGESYSCVFDENSSIQLTPNFFKIICWYENEYSYACRVLDTIMVSENQTMNIPIKITNIRSRSSYELNAVQKTKCFKKEMVAVCGNATVNSKIMTTTSQDTDVKIKSSLPHPLFIKKPAPSSAPSSQTYKDRQRNELFKIWNDISDHSKANVTQKRCSFFGSCVAYPPQPQAKVECNAQERLENVKKELNKMVDISEDLLKKTYSNQSNTLSKDKIKVDNKDNFKANDDSKCDAEIHGHVNKGTVEESGDYNICIDLSNPCQSQNDWSAKDVSVSLMLQDKEISDFSGSCTDKDLSDRHLTELGEEINNANKDYLIWKKLDIERHDKKIETRHEIGKFKQQLTKTTLNASLSQCIEIEYFCNENEIRTTSNKAKITITTAENNNNNCLVSIEDKTSHIIKHKSNKEKNNIKIIEEELRKRNIILVDSSFDPEIGVETKVDTEKKIAETDKKSRDSLLLFAPDEAVTYTEVASRCVSSENTMRSNISNAAYEYKQDIYDKLDSASASDSNNSFEINERKSQVIQFADLTKSLDDLGRLDKICRIIEISDELSDKLFSALDDDNGCDLRSRRWSFRDLCVRIKLDEFCNKVFGATAV